MTKVALQPPTVGRAVHYYAEGNSPEEEHSGPFAGTVTAVLPDTGAMQHVHLVVFFPGNNHGHAKTSVPYSEQPKKGCWSWPPRV